MQLLKAQRKGTGPVKQLPACGLCGRAGNLMQTECCGRWICDDEDKYVLFSYARNSCSRNHRRFTLCGFHHVEGHEGDWQTCRQCQEGFETEMYVYYGTNEYNFEKLENPPAYESTRCAKCDAIISLGKDGYSMRKGEHYCEDCGDRLVTGTVTRTAPKIGRNDLCPCGSGVKHKKCCAG